MSIDIVKATDRDLEQLSRLNRIVQTVHVELSPDIFRSDLDSDELLQFWETRLKEPQSTVAVAMVDGIVSGSIWFEIQDRPRDTLHHSRRRLYVHHIVVDTACRHGGIGLALLDYAEREAKNMGIDSIILDAWAANDTAQSFFAAQGYRPMNIVLAKQLGDT